MRAVAGSGKSGNLHFDVLLWPMTFKFQPKTYRRIISHDTEKRSKLTFYLKNDMDTEFGEL